MAFQSPNFVAGLGMIGVKAAYNAFMTELLPVLAQRMKPEEEARWREARKANQPAPYRHRGGGNPHPDEKD